jgi:hypothetical protein
MKKQIAIACWLHLIVLSAAASQVAAQNEYIKVFLRVTLEEGKDTLTINTEIYSRLSEIPVNISLPSFQWIIKATYETSRSAYADIPTRLTLNFSMSTTENLTTIAEEAKDEFLRAFNHTHLHLSSEGQTIVNDTDSTLFIYWFYDLPLTVDSMKAFLENGKSNQSGLCKFVSGEFLAEYVPGNSTSGMLAKYTLNKNDSAYYWEFVIITAKSGEFHLNYNEPVTKTMELQKILNSETLNTGDSDAQIQFNVRENLTSTPDIRYRIQVKRLTPQPNESFLREDGLTINAWELGPHTTANVTADLEFTKLNNDKDNKDNTNIIEIAAAALVAAAVLAIITYIVNRKKPKQKPPQKTSNNPMTLLCKSMYV